MLSQRANNQAAVYLLQIHAYAEQVFDLFSYLYNERDHFVFYPDTKSPLQIHHMLSLLERKFRNVYVIQSELVSWGGISQVRSTFSGLKFAVEELKNWSHLIPLSGQHLPLHSADEIANSLDVNTSYIPSSDFWSKGPLGKADLLHRFEMKYKEVAGVGVFGVSPRSTDEFLKALLHSGSNWVALCRPLCESLVEHPSISKILGYFSESLQADETALHTIVCGLGFRSDLKVDTNEFTFVANPRNGGGQDMVFSEENFWFAQQNKYLFIRKRPKVLPLNIEAYLKSNILVKMEAYKKLNIPCESSTGADIRLLELTEKLENTIKLRRENVSIRRLDKNKVSCPSLCLQVRHPDMRSDLFVSIMSENLTDFKVSLIWLDSFEPTYEQKEFGGCLATIIKVRAHDVAYKRELHIKEDKLKGFLTISKEEDLENLICSILLYFDKAINISKTTS